MDAGLLAEELADVILPPSVVHVRVDAIDHARTVAVNVGRGGAAVWSKRFDLVVSDCPAAPQAIGGSIRSGLAPLPGWLVGGTPDSSWTIDVPVTLSVGVGEPVEARMGIGGRTVLDVGACCLVIGLAGELGTPTALSSGSAQIAEVAAELGWALEPPRARFSIMAGVRAGPALSWGAGFAKNTSDLAPFAALWLSAGFHPSQRWILAAGVRANLVRLAPSAGDAAGQPVPESWFRAEFSVVPRFHANFGSR